MADEEMLFLPGDREAYFLARAYDRDRRPNPDEKYAWWMTRRCNDMKEAQKWGGRPWTCTRQSPCFYCKQI